MTFEQLEANHDGGSPSLKDLEQILGVPLQKQLHTSADKRFVKQFSIGYARAHQVLGIQSPGDDKICLAICDINGWMQADNVSRLLKLEVEPTLAPRDVVVSAINTAYSERGAQHDDLLRDMHDNDLLEAVMSSTEDLLDSSGRAPVIQLVNQILFDAVVAGASDIHVQPAEDRLIIRQRIDGVLFDSLELPKGIQESVLTRLKVLGQMDIAEKRLPQDGRATVELGERIVDLRIASLPTSHSERIVVRLLDKSARLYTLEELGMDADTLSFWRQQIQLDHGLILVTGPTGSGKSTTLYSALQEINSTEANILTLEDPIEYQLDGISQSQINEKKGLTFASGMRSVLRQDPDIIMVGEIRDSDTANMAIQASLTGHLVFSTLHTNDAASAVTRLLDLGVEPYLVASSLVASLAQRLVRKLCPACREPVAEVQGQADRYVPRGCDRCRDTGFRGRVGLFELLTVNEHIRDLIQVRANASTVRECGVKNGMRLLSMDGKAKVQQGATTLAEVFRATSVA